MIYSITRFLFNQRSIRAILSLAPILTKHFSIVFTGLLRLFFVAHLSGDRLVKGVLEIFLVSEVVLKSVCTVFAAIADTSVGAGNTTLVALAVLFKAARLLAVAPLRVLTGCLLDLRLKGMRIAVSDGFHGIGTLFIAFFIAAVATVAVRATTQAKCETVTIEFEAL